MNIVGYYVGPTVDIRLGDGSLLCDNPCYQEWRSDLIDYLIGLSDPDHFVEFGFRRTLSYDEAVAEVERQSVPMFDTEEMDYRPACEECLARYVASRRPDGTHLISQPEPFDVALTSDGRISEGVNFIDLEEIRREWEGGRQWCSSEIRTRQGEFDVRADGGYPYLYDVIYDQLYSYSHSRERFNMCAPCAVLSITEHLGEYRIANRSIFYEGAPIDCDGWCGEMIESAYGDPDAEEVDEQGAEAALSSL